MSSTQTLLQDFRGRVPSSLRAPARRMADALLGLPLGSLRGARTTERVIALTFDDGPDPHGTPAVLAALATHKVRATFFMLADRAEAHSELARRVVGEGHEVGLHGATHERLPRLPVAQLAGWLEHGRRRLEAVVERPVRLFRPPFGSQSPRTFRTVTRGGLEVVVWSADAADWEPDTPALIAGRGLAGLKPGYILLLHDAFAPDPYAPQAAPDIDRGAVVSLLLAGLLVRDYRAGTVSDLLSGRRAWRSVWFRP